MDTLGNWKRSDYCGQLTARDIGREVVLMGWALRRRDHGGLIFIDLRDREGIAQIVFDPEVNPVAHQVAEGVRSEFVLAVKGKVIPRPEGTVNPNMKTGEVEIQVAECKLLNRSKPLPFMLDEHSEVNENIRLKYRYLDMRRPQLAAEPDPAPPGGTGDPSVSDRKRIFGVGNALSDQIDPGRGPGLPGPIAGSTRGSSMPCPSRPSSSSRS